MLPGLLAIGILICWLKALAVNEAGHDLGDFGCSLSCTSLLGLAKPSPAQKRFKRIPCNGPYLSVNLFIGLLCTMMDQFYCS